MYFPLLLIILLNISNGQLSAPVQFFQTEYVPIGSPVYHQITTNSGHNGFPRGMITGARAQQQRQGKIQKQLEVRPYNPAEDHRRSAKEARNGGRGRQMNNGQQPSRYSRMQQSLQYSQPSVYPQNTQYSSPIDQEFVIVSEGQYPTVISVPQGNEIPTVPQSSVVVQPFPSVRQQQMVNVPSQYTPITNTQLPQNPQTELTNNQPGSITAPYTEQSQQIPFNYPPQNNQPTDTTQNNPVPIGTNGAGTQETPSPSQEWNENRGEMGDTGGQIPFTTPFPMETTTTMYTTTPSTETTPASQTFVDNGEELSVVDSVVTRKPQIIDGATEDEKDKEDLSDLDVNRPTSGNFKNIEDEHGIQGEGECDPTFASCSKGGEKEKGELEWKERTPTTSTTQTTTKGIDYGDIDDEFPTMDDNEDEKQPTTTSKSTETVELPKPPKDKVPSQLAVGKAMEESELPENGGGGPGKPSEGKEEEKKKFEPSFLESTVSKQEKEESAKSPQTHGIEQTDELDHKLGSTSTPPVGKGAMGGTGPEIVSGTEHGKEPPKLKESAMEQLTAELDKGGGGGNGEEGRSQSSSKGGSGSGSSQGTASSGSSGMVKSPATNEIDSLAAISEPMPRDYKNQKFTGDSGSSSLLTAGVPTQDDEPLESEEQTEELVNPPTKKRFRPRRPSHGNLRLLYDESGIDGIESTTATIDLTIGRTKEEYLGISVSSNESKRTKHSELESVPLATSTDTTTTEPCHATTSDKEFEEEKEMIDSDVLPSISPRTFVSEATTPQPQSTVTTAQEQKDIDSDVMFAQGDDSGTVDGSISFGNDQWTATQTLPMWSTTSIPSDVQSTSGSTQQTTNPLQIATHGPEELETFDKLENNTRYSGDSAPTLGDPSTFDFSSTTKNNNMTRKTDTTPSIRTDYISGDLSSIGGGDTVKQVSYTDNDRTTPYPNGNSFPSSFSVDDSTNSENKQFVNEQSSSPPPNNEPLTEFDIYDTIASNHGISAPIQPSNKGSESVTSTETPSRGMETSSTRDGSNSDQSASFPSTSLPSTTVHPTLSPSTPDFSTFDFPFARKV